MLRVVCARRAMEMDRLEEGEAQVDVDREIEAEGCGAGGPEAAAAAEAGGGASAPQSPGRRSTDGLLAAVSSTFGSSARQGRRGPRRGRGVGGSGRGGVGAGGAAAASSASAAAAGAAVAAGGGGASAGEAAAAVPAARYEGRLEAGAERAAECGRVGGARYYSVRCRRAGYGPVTVAHPMTAFKDCCRALKACGQSELVRSEFPMTRAASLESLGAFFKADDDARREADDQRRARALDAWLKEVVRLAGWGTLEPSVVAEVRDLLHVSELVPRRRGRPPRTRPSPCAVPGDEPVLRAEGGRRVVVLLLHEAAVPVPQAGDALSLAPKAAAAAPPAPPAADGDAERATSSRRTSRRRRRIAELESVVARSRSASRRSIPGTTSSRASRTRAPAPGRRKSS